MPIERADILYPLNSTTVDTGAGIDIRLLSSAQGGADDDTQDCDATHTQDDVERTFDPATAGVTTAASATSLQKKGWALRLAEDMTPSDITNCVAMLNAGTLVVSIVVAIDQTGGTYVSGTYGPRWRASLWKYNIAADTGTQIAVGSVTTPTWDITPATGDLGDFKTATISLVIASNTTFTLSETLLLQIGLNTMTIPNPTLGTATWTYTLRVDHVNTNIDFAAGQGIRAACSFSNDLTGKGTVTRGALAVGIPRTLIGKGTVTSSKAVIASKSFNLVGKGTVSHTKAVAMERSLVGKGEILTTGANASTITIPIDEVPTGGGAVKKNLYIFDD